MHSHLAPQPRAPVGRSRHKGINWAAQHAMVEQAAQNRLDARLVSLFRTHDKWPDDLAIRKLQELNSAWPTATSHVVAELTTNFGSDTTPGMLVDFVIEHGNIDADGNQQYLMQLAHRPCNLCSQPADAMNRAIMMIVRRWFERLGSSRKRQRDDEEAKREAPAQPPAPQPPQPPQLLQPPQPPRPLQPSPAPLVQAEPTQPEPAMIPLDEQARLNEKYINERITGATLGYKVRYHLHAAGVATEFTGGPQMALALQALAERLRRACDENAPLGKINAIAQSYHVALGLADPPAGRTHRYCVRVPLDFLCAGGGGPLTAEPPIEEGMTLAHQRFGDRLLRVRIAPLPKSASNEERRDYATLRRELISQGFHFCGRNFRHFAHKDAEKDEAKASIWFVAIGSVRLEQKCMRLARSMLLDQMAWKDGVESKGRMHVSKVAARLTLAFSTTVSVPECAPSPPPHPQVAAVRDLRGKLGDRRGSELYRYLQTELPALPPGDVKLVIVDDEVGHHSDGTVATDATGDAYVMTDGAGLIAHNLACKVPPCASGRKLEEDRGDGVARETPLLMQVRIWL